jgi:hypothetical protein
MNTQERAAFAALLANHERLTDWMREWTSPRDGDGTSKEILIEGLKLAEEARRAIE